MSKWRDIIQVISQEMNKIQTTRYIHSSEKVVMLKPKKPIEALNSKIEEKTTTSKEKFKKITHYEFM